MDDKLIEKIEALLFASGKPLTADFLMNILEEKNKRNVNSSLKKLKESYDQRKSPLMLVEQDGAWKLTVREEFLPLVRKIVADTELSKTVLETLAVIAWKAPVLQANVIKVRTNKAYEHIDVLEKMGFITRKKEGRSFKLSLSEKFYEYFDVQHGDIKTMFKDVKRIEKELEDEQQKHQNRDVEGSDAEDKDQHVKEAIEKKENEDSDIKSEIEHDIDITEAIDAEKPHLGNLEVVDSINSKAPEAVEIVDSIDSDDDLEDEDISDNLKVKNKKFDEAEEKDIDEVIEELDEEQEAIEEVEEILEESMTPDEK